MSSSIVTGSDSPKPLLSRRVPLQDKWQAQLLQRAWATAPQQLPEQQLSSPPTTTTSTPQAQHWLWSSVHQSGLQEITYFSWELRFVGTFQKCSFAWFQTSVVKGISLGKTLKQFWPMKKPRFSGSEEQTQARTWKPARNKVESCRSLTWPLSSTSLAQALAKVFKGNNSNQTRFPSPAGRVKEGQTMPDLFPHPGWEQDSPKHFSCWSCVKSRAGCVLQTHSQTDCSSDSIPCGLLCTQDSYITVSRLRLLAVSWTLLHNTEPLSHCLPVLRASAWAGSSGWQGVSDLAQILDFITPVTLLECFEIKELPSLFPCLSQVQSQKHNQKTPPNAEAARPVTSLCVTFSIQVHKSSFQHLRQHSLVVTAAVEFRSLGQLWGIPALTQILAKYCRTTAVLIGEHSSTESPLPGKQPW